VPTSSSFLVCSAPAARVGHHGAARPPTRRGWSWRGCRIQVMRFQRCAMRRAATTEGITRVGFRDALGDGRGYLGASRRRRSRMAAIRMRTGAEHAGAHHVAMALRVVVEPFM